MNDITKLRIALGISQMKLAKISGVKRYGISLHECGYKSLGSNDLSKIIEALRKYSRTNGAKVRKESEKVESLTKEISSYVSE